MSRHVEPGALCRCQFGSSVAELRGASAPLSVRDFVPFDNLQPFGRCAAPGNPAVAQADGRGARVPAPCVPAVEQPWSDGGEPVGWGTPALLPGATTRCRHGGLIHVVLPTKP